MAYGSGSLFQRGKRGIWYYQAWQDGRQLGPFSSHSTDRKQAQRELDKLLGKRARGEIGFSPDRLTVGAILESYLAHARVNLALGTVDEYRSHIEHQLSPSFGNLRPDRLTHAHLEAYRVRRLSDFALKYSVTGPIVLAHRVSQTTINRELAVLRAALKRALDTDRKLSFTLPKFPMVREDNVRRGFITEAEFERLYRVLPYAGLQALAACCLHTLCST